MAYELRTNDTFFDADGRRPIAGLSSATLVDIVVKTHQRMLDDVEVSELRRLGPADLLVIAQEMAGLILKAEGVPVIGSVRQKVGLAVVDEISGYGPIQALLDDPGISEIMVNGPQHIYVERCGKIYKDDRVFRDDVHLMRIIERIVLPLGRRIDESSPMVDARLPDGSRVNAIIPPLAINGPTLTVRKFSREPFGVEDLIAFKTMTPDMAEFCQACVRAKLNILISGGTGSGKTTTLNVLSSFVPNDERIVTIEDAAELQLQQDHVVALESRPPNLEGRGEITIRQLVRNALRMRPDRIIVGEVRGAESLDMLQAMNTGHEGSLSTIHCNSPRDALSRLETTVMMAGIELPGKAIREQIASAIHLIVHQARLIDGSRKIVQVSEVQGMEGDVIVLQDIFQFNQKAVDSSGKVVGEIKAIGLRPKLMSRLHSHGIDLPVEIFHHNQRKVVH